MTYKMIIDTDPGIDDALAIAFACLHPQIELLGLTTVFGNVSVAQATANAGFLLDLLKCPHVPVAQGAAVPLHQEPHSFPDFVHGTNGFGDVAVTYPAHFKAHTLSAAQFIVEQINARPGEIVLVPVGPLTNIAQALLLDPSIVGKVKQVVVMGGAAHVHGNVSPAAEANFWNDAHAAQQVMAAAWPVVMVGLDVTYQTIMPNEPMERIKKASPILGGFLYDICGFYAHFYKNVAGFDGFSLHDPATVMYVTNPELFKTRQGQVDVVVDAVGYGKSFFAPKGQVYAEASWSVRDNAKVCLEVDAPAVLRLFGETLSRAY